MPDDTAREVGYLPMHCPACDRVRLRYWLNDTNHVVSVECEKCSWTSDLDTERAPAHHGAPDQRWWPTAAVHATPEEK